MIVVGVFSTVTYLDELLFMVKGAVGPLLILVGAFIVWLESDEWKMRRQEDQTRTGVREEFQTREDSQEETQESTDRYACPECGKEFDTERGMKIHQAQKHD